MFNKQRGCSPSSLKRLCVGEGFEQPLHRLCTVTGPRIKAVSQRSSEIDLMLWADGHVQKELSQHRGTLFTVSFLTISSCSHFKTKCKNQMLGNEDLPFPGRGK